MLMIIEDNPHFSLVLQRMLISGGHAHEIVDAGEEAVRRMLVRGEQFGLVLLDLSLPDIPGTAVARAIRSIDDPAKSAVPILVMSSAMPDLPIDELAALRFAGLLAKPFFRRDLEAAIAAHARAVPEL